MTKKLKLQREALKAYADGDMYHEKLSNHSVNEDGDLDGDTLALFVWHEVGNANGDRQEAIRMIEKAITELQEVSRALDVRNPA